MKVGYGSCVLLIIDEEIQNGDSWENVGMGHCSFVAELIQFNLSHSKVIIVIERNFKSHGYKSLQVIWFITDLLALYSFLHSAEKIHICDDNSLKNFYRVSSVSL